MTATWLKVRSGTWHAWVKGSPSSACGHVRAEDLAAHPAKAVADGPPPPDKPERGRACQQCLRRLGLAGEARQGQTSAEIAAEWVGKIKLLLRHRRVRLPRQEDIEDFADLLTRLGSVRDPEAVEAFTHVSDLLLRPVRKRRGDRAYAVISDFREALEKIPPRKDKLLHLAHTVKLWRQITSRSVSQGGQFRASQVVGVMLDVPDPEAYIKRLHDKEFYLLGAVFHPNTLSSAKKDGALRGVFWDGARSEEDPLEGWNVAQYE